MQIENGKRFLKFEKKNSLTHDRRACMDVYRIHLRWSVAAQQGRWWCRWGRARVANFLVRTSVFTFTFGLAPKSSTELPVLEPCNKWESLHTLIIFNKNFYHHIAM